MLQNYSNPVPDRNAELLLAQARQSVRENWSIEGSDVFGQMCEYAVLQGGKLFRPMLLLDASLSVSMDTERAQPAAAGIEYAHIASLVHDDIIDQDDERRGRQAVHRRYGVPSALLVGDALIFQTFRALATCFDAGAAPDLVVRAVELYAQAGLDMCRGQALEAQVTGDLQCSCETYFEVVRLKTASLFRCAAECGAVLGGGTSEQIRLLAEYGEQLGILFQIIDDLLCYTSAPARTGKSLTTDVSNKRLTLPIIHAYASGTASLRASIEDAFRSNSADAYAVILEAVRATGTIKSVRNVAKEYAQKALSVLAGLPNTPSRQRLESYVHWGLEREG